MCLKFISINIIHKMETILEESSLTGVSEAAQEISDHDNLHRNSNQPMTMTENTGRNSNPENHIKVLFFMRNIESSDQKMLKKLR